MTASPDRFRVPPAGAPAPGPSSSAPGNGAGARFPTFRHEALYQRIANHVRELIASEQLHPGERLPAERDLARMLGVSRVPIREAMRTLAAQGLIEIRRGQGMFVANSAVDATVDQLTNALLKQRDLLAELFAVRRLLEPASAQWAAARRDPDESARLEELLAEMHAAAEADPPDYELIGERDMQLHVAIAVAADNRVLVRIMQAMQDLHREQLETSLRYRDRLSSTLRDHSRLVQAIKAGDPVEARSAMLDHLANSEAATMARIEGDETEDEPPAGG